MATVVDFNALQAHQGPRVALMPPTYVGPTVTGTDFSDFSVFASVYVSADGLIHGGQRPHASLTVTVQHSDDGNSWSTAATLTLSNDGTSASLVSSPKAHMRAVATGAASEWQVTVTAAPSYLDLAGDGGGGSQTLRVLGPYTVTQADVPNDHDFFVLPYTPAAGDIIIDIMCRVVTAFDAGGGPVQLDVYDGADGSHYGSGPFDLTVASAANPNTSANGAEPLADNLRVPFGTALTTPAFMGGTPPVAQEVLISYADTPVAVGEAALYFFVATPSL